MNISWNLHPLEISRKCRRFYRDSLSDFEVRHPETRRRLAIELKYKLSAQDRPLFNSLIKRFESARVVISFFDWPILLEWNEWRQQADCLAEIQACLIQGTSERQSETLKKIRERLLQIQDLIRSEILEDEPSLWTCCRFRWKFSPIREEANYLVYRWRQLEIETAIAS